MIRRPLTLLALCWTLVPAPSTAQDSTTTSKTAPRVAAPRPDSTLRARQAPTVPDSSRAQADSTRRGFDATIRIQVDAKDSTHLSQVEWGEKRVAAGDTVRGDFVNFFGDTEIRGVVLGDAVALFGDLTIQDGAYVQGDAVAVGGEVRVHGGEVGGNIVTSERHGHDDDTSDAAADPDWADHDEPQSRLGALFAVLVAMVMLSVTGVIVAAVMPQRLDTMTRHLEAGVGRAFAAGLLVELGFVPILLFVLLLLVVTVLGILLIPFAVVLLPLLYLVFGGLGWFATATLVGRGLTGAEGGDRRTLIRSIAIGTGVLLLPYALAALLPDWGAPTALAFTVVWVAATAGFGAAVLSRGGRAPSPPPEPPPI